MKASDESKNVYTKYKNLYRDLIFGYSEERFESNNKKVFIKHLNDLETGRSERQYQDFLFLGQEKGLKTEEQTIDFLIDEKIWSEKNEKRIEDLRDKISELEASKSKLIIKAQLTQLQKELKPLEDELYILCHERHENVGMTAQSFAGKKISESTIQSSFYKNRELTELFYTEEEFDYLSHVEVNEALGMYGEMVSKKFEGEEIKRVAVCPFFMNTFILCNDDVSSFFGKPILQLTNFQVTLASFAKYFKGLMSNHKNPPEDYYKSPDRIIEWYELQSKSAEAKSLEGKGEAGGRSLMKANKEELSALENESEGVMNLNKEIKDGGGKLDMEQIMKMHGL